MKLAICQTNIQFENYEKNLANMEEILTNYCKEADLVLFPEMSLTGFSMNIKKTGDRDGRTVAAVKKLSLKYHLAIGFGWTRIGEGDKAQNHYTVIDGSGEVIGDYIKIHPFSFAGEDECFTGGKTPCVFNYKGVNIGIAICYDLRFPEIFQAESKNADIIVVPANWPAKREDHWNTLLKARAIENQIYIAGINCVGNMAGQYYQGDSQVLTPNGELEFRLTDEACVKVIDLGNIADSVAKYRKSFPMKNDRKEALYGTWY